MTFVEFLKDAKKALGAAGTVEAGAVALGLLDNAEAGYVTAGIGAAAGAITYLLRNVPASKPKRKPVKHVRRSPGSPHVSSSEEMSVPQVPAGPAPGASTPTPPAAS